MSFSDQIEAFNKKALNSVKLTVKGVSIKLFSAVIKSSPVDTGRFRNNWQAGFAQPMQGFNNGTDKNGSKSIAAMTMKINSAPVADVFTLSNNLPYASKLEYGGYGDGPKTDGGFSKQSPMGVVRVNAARFQSILDEEARKNR